MALTKGRQQRVSVLVTKILNHVDQQQRVVHSRRKRYPHSGISETTGPNRWPSVELAALRELPGGAELVVLPVVEAACDFGDAERHELRQPFEAA